LEFFVVCFIFIGEHLWEEKRNMKPIKNSEPLNKNGVEIITNETKKNVAKPEWIIIGGKKVWIRTCKCGSVVYHKNLGGFYISRKHNKGCPKCRTIGENNPFYGKKHTEENRKRWSKSRSGERNAMYGIGGMLGKKHSDEGRRKQSIARKRYWKSRGHECVDEFIKYRTEVDRITRSQPIHLLENYEKRGRAGDEGTYHLDHRTSVWFGYKNNISPEEIGHISNLRFIHWLENQKKWYHNE
jgi:hypothetical protein